MKKNSYFTQEFIAGIQEIVENFCEWKRLEIDRTMMIEKIIMKTFSNKEKNE